jgi:hypothetical protein
MTPADPKQNSEGGWPPLARAIFESDATQVAPAVAGGDDPNGSHGSMTLVELAAFHGQHHVLEALIHAGARVPQDALTVLGVMDVTDYMIESPEEEENYARTARILLDHGATPNVLADDGRPLIETFPEHQYPKIHGVLSRPGSP